MCILKEVPTYFTSQPGYPRARVAQNRLPRPGSIHSRACIQTQRPIMRALCYSQTAPAKEASPALAVGSGWWKQGTAPRPTADGRMDGMGRVARAGRDGMGRQTGWVASTKKVGGMVHSGASFYAGRALCAAFDSRLATWRDAPTRYNPCLAVRQVPQSLGSQPRTQPLSPSTSATETSDER